MSSPLGAVIDDLSADRRELLVANPPDDDLLADVLEYFERFDVSAVERVGLPALPGGTVLVSDGGRCLAAVDLHTLHAYLFGGGHGAPGVAGADERPADGDGLSDAAVTGVQQFLARLDNRVYTVTEETTTPMVGVSRHIEQRAFAAGEGTIHAGFQRLSRLRESRDTLDTYRTLADRGIDVAVYGVPDWEPPGGNGLAVYADADGGVVGDFWFVAVDSPDGGGALVAREGDPGTYTGFWTFRPPLVGDVVETLERRVRPELTRAGA
jgi:hypothetical protein